MELLEETRTGLSPWAEAIFLQKYSLEKKETWAETSERVVSNVLGALGYSKGDYEYDKLLEYVVDRKFIPGGRYLYSAGRPLHQCNNCFLARVEDSREGWANLLWQAGMVLQTGGGFGVDYSAVREFGSPITKTGGVASGPVPLMQMVNEVGRGVIQGGERRSALIALLDWDHPDIMKFIHTKDWDERIMEMKKEDGNSFAPMDMTNISVGLNDSFFEKYAQGDYYAKLVYHEVVKNMVKTGEPGFTVNLGDQANDTLRNPCGEVTSSDDSDVCNLGSLNFARIENKTELHAIQRLAALFLLAGTVYSDIPYDKVDEVRSKNRRIGLGIMGLHEWLLQREWTYEPNDELAEWLDVYADTKDMATHWARKHKLSDPIAATSIAPTGTIGILGETTTGIEPIFAVAYKRRYLAQGQTWKYQYVIDPTAKRLIDQGINPNDIEDAYVLSYNVERRIAMQAWIQQYVDMGVSSTINLPYPITDKYEVRDFQDTLIQYLPSLRGITVFPNGARGNQPLEAVAYEEAEGKEGVVFEEDIELSCRNGQCGV